MFRVHRIAKTALVALISVICAAAAALAGRTQTASADGASYRVPVLMYHSVCKNSRVHSDYIISPERFEEDIRYLKANGYTAVFTEDIVNYVRNGKPLPEKSVIITLDDGFYNNLSNVLPVLKKYGFKATVSVVGSYCAEFSENKDKNPAYAYLAWEDISVLAASGYVEIGSHTYDLHALGTRRGCKIRKGESPEQYKSLLKDDLTRLQNALSENCGVAPRVFAYPFGECCDESREVLSELGFSAAYNCREKVNTVRRDTDLYRLCRINRAGHLSTAEFMSKWGI